MIKEDSALLQKAIEFASLKHRGQVRKGDGRPYILHPFSVLNLLYKYKKSTNIFLLAIVCLLHDISEDCGFSIEEISQMFGYKVASIVEELTSNKEEIEKVGKAVYLTEKMNKMTSYALLIKLLDRLDNVSDLENMKEEFKENYKKETNYILDNLNRKLSKTHSKIIKDIRKIVS